MWYAAVGKSLNDDAVAGMRRVRLAFRNGAVNQRPNRHVVRARIRLDDVHCR